MPNKVDTSDARLAEFANSQHGLVTTKQLMAAGIGRAAISERTRSGRLHRIHRGVYAVGHRGLSLHGRFMAAVLACGERAVLSHGSAAVLWDLLKPLDGPIHVSVTSTSGRSRRSGVHLHRCPSLSAPVEPSPSPSYLQREGGRGRRLLTTYRHNIPVTTIQRTIDDIEGVLPPHPVRRAKRQAELKGIRLEGAEGRRLRSDLEALFLAIVHHHRITPPESNVKLGRHEVDFLWRDHMLVVEVDSFTYHRGSVAFHEDRARDLDLRQSGFTVLRFDERQLEEEPERVAADVAAALTPPRRRADLSV
jgi:very-short-patch-repair endonuclease